MANVSVSNTTGLYIGSGAASVLNNAQQLLGLLSNNGGVVFSLDPTTSNTKVQGNAQAGGGNYGNSNVAAFLPTYTGAISSMTGNLTTTANVQGAFILGNGSQLTGIAAGSNYSNTNVAAFLPTYTGAMTSMTGAVTTTANVTGAFILGNGSQLTGISSGSTYGDSNVAAFLPTYTGAMTSMTGNVTTTANVQGAFILGNGSQLTGISSGSTYGDSNVAIFLPNYTGAITSMTGNLTTTANVQGAFILGNGSALTGITTNYSNTNVAAFLPTYTGAITSLTGNVTTTANVQGGNIIATANVLAGNIVTSGSSGNISGANYITANFFVGNGSLLTGISSGSSYGDSNVALFLPNYTGAMTSMTGNVTTTANVQAAFFIGNGSQLTGIAGGGNATPGGSTTFIQFNNAGVFDGSANLIYEPADGNITLGNLVFNKNYNRILQTNAFDTTVQSATQNATGQFIVGDGWNGNVTSPSFNNNQSIDGAFALINKSYTKTDNGRRTSGLGVQTFVNVTANLTNGGSRITGVYVAPRIGGNITQTAINSQAIVGINTLLTVGGGSSTFASLGNANLRVAVGVSSSVEPVAGSFIGNTYGYMAGIQGTASGQLLTRAINYTINSAGTGNAPAFYGYHMPNSSSYGGIAINNAMRNSAEYYFLYNEDDVAQVRLGSLRRYTEYRANITSSGGNLTIDKTVAQVQYLTPTETVNNVSYTNFVTSASDGTNNDTQADTVTLIVQQGSTPYSITMPTGVEYLYAGNVRTVGNTANSVTMISTTATKNVSGDTDLYLITISPEFV